MGQVLADERNEELLQYSSMEQEALRTSAGSVMEAQIRGWHAAALAPQSVELASLQEFGGAFAAECQPVLAVGPPEAARRKMSIKHRYLDDDGGILFRCPASRGQASASRATHILVGAIPAAPLNTTADLRAALDSLVLPDVPPVIAPPPVAARTLALCEIEVLGSPWEHPGGLLGPRLGSSLAANVPRSGALEARLAIKWLTALSRNVSTGISLVESSDNALASLVPGKLLLPSDVLADGMALAQTSVAVPTYWKHTAIQLGAIRVPESVRGSVDVFYRRTPVLAPVFFEPGSGGSIELYLGDALPDERPTKIRVTGIIRAPGRTERFGAGLL